MFTNTIFDYFKGLFTRSRLTKYLTYMYVQVFYIK